MKRIIEDLFTTEVFLSHYLNDSTTFNQPTQIEDIVVRVLELVPVYKSRIYFKKKVIFRLETRFND